MDTDANLYAKPVYLVEGTTIPQHWADYIRDKYNKNVRGFIRIKFNEYKSEYDIDQDAQKRGVSTLGLKQQLLKDLVPDLPAWIPPMPATRRIYKDGRKLTKEPKTKQYPTASNAVGIFCKMRPVVRKDFEDEAASKGLAIEEAMRRLMEARYNKKHGIK